MTHSRPRGRRAERPCAPYSEALAEAICDAAAQGLSLAAIGRRRAMPPRATVDQWLKNRPEFAEAFGLAVAAGGGRPCRYTPEIAAELCRRLGEGEALRRLCGEPAMPSRATVQLWQARHAEFACMMRQALEVRVQGLFDEIREIADAATPETLQVDRMRISARQWLAARIAPNVLGARAGEGGKAAPAVFDVEVVEF